MEQYRVIGLMSGSSLDGLDIANCIFSFDDNVCTDWEIESAETVPLPEQILNQISSFDTLNIIEIEKLSLEFSKFLVSELRKREQDYDLIANHGHTLFHYPKEQITYQLSNNAFIANQLHKLTIGDFRAQDIWAGGEGTPMAALADRDLFGQYDAWINFGGIVNLSLKTKDGILAFDVAPCNQVLNYYANQLGFAFDRNGKMAAQGKKDQDYLKFLSEISYNNIEGPKSLDNNQVFEEWISPSLSLNLSEMDALHSYCHWLSERLASHIDQDHIHSVLLTGGGVFNEFLMDCLRSKTKVELIVPSSQLINYKESLLIAYAGILRYKGIPNFVSSATGASKDMIGGTIYGLHKN